MNKPDAHRGADNQFSADVLRLPGTCGRSVSRRAVGASKCEELWTFEEEHQDNFLQRSKGTNLCENKHVKQQQVVSVNEC